MDEMNLTDAEEKAGYEDFRQPQCPPEEETKPILLMVFQVRSGS